MFLRLLFVLYKRIVALTLSHFSNRLLPIKHERFYELAWLERIIFDAPPGARVETLATVQANGERLPILAISLGPDDKTMPVYGLFAGVHGLERIGVHVVLAFLESLFARMHWNTPLAGLMEHCRLVTIPIVNPGGLLLKTRSNPNGIDLMRNAPVEANDKVPFLLGGHRYGPRWPWYRGPLGAPMQAESQALVDFCLRELLPARAMLSLDVHSGFGRIDRLWFPYAHSKVMFDGIDHVRRLKSLLDRSYPHHVYWIEQQSNSYMTHGDLWDYVYLQWLAKYQKQGLAERHFVPWTLEMGSWTWVRKNPRQLFSRLGPFNPMTPHRYERILRRHMFLLEFFLRAIRNHQRWAYSNHIP